MYNKAEKKARNKFLEMLIYKRPEGGITQKIFCEKYIQPMMGKPDEFGNYIKVIQHEDREQKIRHCFMAHHDTVHTSEGLQKLEIWTDKNGDEYVGTQDANCLGADCTSGVWLILEMIKAKIPGVYIIHAAEEVGGVGSSLLIQKQPMFLSDLEFAIAFDRYGENSVITHQSCGKCCSDEFVSDIESILNLNLKPDSYGTFTDSAHYVDDVSECTNLSVGYYKQHTKDEVQNITFLMRLRDRLIKADWEKLVAYRDKKDTGWSGYSNLVNGFKSRWDEDDWDNYYNNDDSKGVQSKKDEDDEVINDYTKMYNVVKYYPRAVADMLESYGFDPEDVVKYAKEYYSNSIAF